MVKNRTQRILIRRCLKRASEARTSVEDIRNTNVRLVLKRSALLFTRNRQRKKHACWSPKCNNCPKCNKVLNVITFDPKCNKLLNVISLQCNRLTPSVHCCYGGHPHWDVSDSCCTKKPLTSIHVTLRARWRKSEKSENLRWRKSFPAQSGLVLGWKLNRMESIGT